MVGGPLVARAIELGAASLLFDIVGRLIVPRSTREWKMVYHRDSSSAGLHRV
jgi:hypothetical protein